MSTRREYQSARRQDQARETRARIRRAARDLFARQGFAATTISRIARAAGVSQPTVYAAFESKAGIVLAMLEEMEESADVGAQLQAVFAEPEPRRQLRLWLAAHRDLFVQGGDVLRAAMAAGEHPDVAALIERGDSNRRAVIQQLVELWANTGALRNGLTREEAADRMWLLTTVEGFLTATDRLGWSAERYESWLANLIEHEVLEPVSD